jgi:hypothetical protein
MGRYLVKISYQKEIDAEDSFDAVDKFTSMVDITTIMDNIEVEEIEVSDEETTED